MKTDPRVDAYIRNAEPFAQPILSYLRVLVHEACPEAEETLKWRMPFFTYKGILCGMAAFTEHCSFHFWNGAHVVENAYEAEGMGQFGKLRSVKDLPPDKKLIGYIKKATAMREAGIKKQVKSSPKAKKELVIPTVLIAALKKNKKAAATFEAFSYSHKKEYTEWIAEAKRPESVTKRLETTLEWLTEGKPRNWKRQNC
ncbi:MAG: hypothetical protein JWN25_2943 [Verrucomicrobiales bacterium]|nr:hypothetical protein [Verrucomicrobiales bacterium]